MVKKKTAIKTSESSKKSYHERVTEELKKQGKSQQWLADTIGKKKQDMQRILKMNKNPKYVPEISELLDVSPEWLRTGEGEKYIYIKVNSVPVNLYSLLDLKFKKTLSGTKILEKILIIGGNSNFALLMDDLTIACPRYPEGALLLFQSDIDYKTTIKNSKTTQYVLIHQNKENIILFCQALFTKDSNDIQFKPMENYPDNPAYHVADCNILGLLKETRVRL